MDGGDNSNTKEAQDIKVYNAVLLAYKGSKACESERKRFALCRATGVGRSGDPSFCETQAADFLQCYHEMVMYVRQKCQTQYLDAFNCIQKSDNKGIMSGLTDSLTGHDMSKECSKAMHEFHSC